jgi:hypothetical protein
VTWLGPEVGKGAVFMAYALLLVCCGFLFGTASRKFRMVYLRRRFK